MIDIKTSVEPEVPEELWLYTDRRIRQEAKDYMVNPDTGKFCITFWDELVSNQFPDITKLVFVGGSAVGFLMETNEWVHAITVVNPDYRNKGIGTELLTRRLIVQKIVHPEAVRKTTVAADNPPSLRMCEKANYIERNRYEGKRESGTFEVVEMFNKEVK